MKLPALTRPIEIIGGGLAGLSLGVALARAGVPTTLIEAGHYPRHRVCGEFIAGLAADTRQTLGLDALLTDARQHHTVSWFHRGRTLAVQRLPQPALGLSRYALDQRLARAFVAAGGELQENRRAEDLTVQAGRVFALGRAPQRSEWLGIKAHMRGLSLASDLELHLGASAYVGLCAVEDDAVNVCGLFHARHAAGGGGTDRLLERALRSCGLSVLAARLQAAEPVAGSLVSVAGLSYASPTPSEAGRLCLGDTGGQIPPFSGSGMALAFQSAACALGPLHAWAEGRMEWLPAVTAARQAMTRRTGRRFRVARFFHPWLLSGPRQRLLAWAQRCHAVPLPLVTRWLHT